MTSQAWFTVLVLAVAGERMVELAVARRNLRWSLQQGGIEYGRRHYPVVVALHTGLLVGCLVEVWWRSPEFHPVFGFCMLGLVVASQLLRWWCIRTLGRRWNTRVVVVAGLAPIRRGPYRVLPHPNYVAVVVEGFALPLVHTAWLTALIFTVLNAIVLSVRIRVENRALADASPSSAAPATTDG